MGRITTVFDNQAQATQAVNDLRAMNISDTHLSFVSKHTQHGEVGDAAAADMGNNVVKGVGAGVAVGALFGIAAALIPGAGPFIAAGALAQTLGAVGGGAVAGAVVGGTAGGIAGAFSNAGYDRTEADYYGGAVERGATVVVADVDDAQEAQVRGVLERHGGHYSGAATSYGAGVAR